MKRIRFIIFSVILILSVYSLSGCKKSEPTIPLGTYTFTNEDGSISEIVLEKDTVCFKNADFTYTEIMYAFQCTQSDSKEADNEGAPLSKEERDEIFRKYKESIDFSPYESKPVNYFTEYEEEEQFIQLYTLDENGDEILGLQATYYLKDKTLGFADDYFTLGNQE